MIGLLLPILATALAQSPGDEASAADAPVASAEADAPEDAASSGDAPAPAEDPPADASVPPADDPTTPGLRQRREARRPYPRRFYDDLSVERRCVVDVAVDDRGRPSTIEPVDCPPELVAYTAKRVRRDRWERPVPEGARARVTVVYRPPAEVAELPAPDYWRRREGGACEIRVAIDAAGHARVARDDAGCAPALAGWPPTPARVLERGKVPKVCPVTFLVVGGEVRGLDLFRCDLRLWRHVREGLRRFDWPATTAPTPYTVQLEFGR